MKKIIGMISGFILIFAFISPVSAATYWDVSGAQEVSYVLGVNNYNHHYSMVQESDGSFSGTGYYIPDINYTEEINGTVTGSSVEFDVLYTGTNAGYTVHATGLIASDGSVSGTALSSTNQFFAWTMSPGAAFMRAAEITAPDEHEVTHGDVSFEAYLVDNDEDSVQWAVREGTCKAGTNTVYGNVDGFQDEYSWVYNPETYIHTFSSIADTSSWTPGMYCFVFNPREGSGESEADIRLKREFYVADWGVHGGGQIIEDRNGKPKDNFKVSFGGWSYDVGSSFMGEWEVNFHNVGDPDYNKSKFHGTDVTSMNWYAPNSNTCTGAMNLTVNGEWNGMPGYRLVMRAGDNGSPGSEDTVRFELWHEHEGLVYDTHDGDFPDESSCVGTARTGLDKGNITIWH